MLELECVFCLASTLAKLLTSMSMEGVLEVRLAALNFHVSHTLAHHRGDRQWPITPHHGEQAAIIFPMRTNNVAQSR